MPTRSPSVHPFAVALALLVVPITRTLWYTQGEGLPETVDYFFYTLSEGWPFWLAYLVATYLLSFLFRKSAVVDESVIDR